jgi:IS30 family transposase
MLAALRRQSHNESQIARKLNTRPRKRLGFRTPLECFKES